MHTRQRAIAIVIAAGALGCAHAPKHAPEPTPNSEPLSDSPTEARERAPGETECVAVHHGQCFDSPDAACVYAGCGDRRCEVLGGSPARVTCTDPR